jgi:hypothetical protein
MAALTLAHLRRQAAHIQGPGTLARAIGQIEFIRRIPFDLRPAFVAGKPKERDFRQAFDHEVARMERFLS